MDAANDANARIAVARRALGLIDLTDLGESTTPEAIDELCRRATGPFGSTAAVCIWPEFVGRAVQKLSGTGVRVATVVNFPAGGEDIDPVVQETEDALLAGADEIDLVLPYHAFVEGRLSCVDEMLDGVRAYVPTDRALKVILETGELPDQEHVAHAARRAIEHGADFVKTSTGKTSRSATPEAVRTMLLEIRETRRETGRDVGIKPSGGIRSVDDAAVYLGLADEIMGEDWASARTFRFGASGLLDAVETCLAGDEPAGSAADDRGTY